MGSQGPSPKPLRSHPRPAGMGGLQNLSMKAVLAILMQIASGLHLLDSDPTFSLDLIRTSGEIFRFLF